MSNSINFTARSVYDDIKNRSTRNTSETLSKLGGVTLSNMAVIKIGKHQLFIAYYPSAKINLTLNIGSFTAMLLGGGFAPALLLVPASVYGSVKLSDYIDSQIEGGFDRWQYGMKEARCGKCLRLGNFRAYRGETHVCANTMCNFSHVYMFACRMWT